MKMKRAHIVPLSKQAISILNKAKELFGDQGYVFPAPRNQNAPMSDNTLGKCFRDLGYKGKISPHRLRTAFSTTAYESSKFTSDVIEKALSHEERNKVKGAYNRAEYLPQRHQLLQWWGDTLHALEFGAIIIEFGRVMNN